MNLGIMLSKISQSQMDTYYFIYLICKNIQNSQTHRTVSMSDGCQEMKKGEIEQCVIIVERENVFYVISKYVV